MVLRVLAQQGPQRRIRIVGVQFRISQKPLERGVFTLEVFEPLGVLPSDPMAACPRGVPKILVAKARSDDLHHDQV
jgi:hypothetical protein